MALKGTVLFLATICLAGWRKGLKGKFVDIIKDHIFSLTCMYADCLCAEVLCFSSLRSLTELQ